MNIGDEAGTAYQTMRGRNFPAIRQFTIFLENRVGQLLGVVRRFEGDQCSAVSLVQILGRFKS